MNIPADFEPVIWMGPLGDGVRRPGVAAAAVLDVCDRCDFAGPHVETLRHEGRSTRRDCGQCNRTLGFPRWYEEPAAGHHPDRRHRVAAGGSQTTQKGSPMKTLTIQQPYASLIADGEKWIENRSWETSFRGPLLIHAGLGRGFLGGADPAGFVMGAAVAIVGEIACYELELIKRNAARAPKEKAPGTGRTWAQLARHQHAEGPVCWVLRDVRKLETPIPMKGLQKLFNAPDDVRAALRAMGVIK